MQKQVPLESTGGRDLPTAASLLLLPALAVPPERSQPPDPRALTEPSWWQRPPVLAPPPGRPSDERDERERAGRRQ